MYVLTLLKLSIFGNTMDKNMFTYQFLIYFFYQISILLLLLRGNLEKKV
jgi:hypothetical protein